MRFTTELRIDRDAIHEFVHSHVRRNRDATLDSVNNGFRVKFGRTMLPHEAALVRDAYEEADTERQNRLDAEWAEAEARKPKGFNKVLASGWRSQTAVGTITLLAALYWILGIEMWGQVLFYGVGVTQGAGLVPVCLIGWGLAGAVVWLLRKAFRYND